MTSEHEDLRSRLPHPCRCCFCWYIASCGTWSEDADQRDGVSRVTGFDGRSPSGFEQGGRVSRSQNSRLRVDGEGHRDCGLGTRVGWLARACPSLIEAFQPLLTSRSAGREGPFSSRDGVPLGSRDASGLWVGARLLPGPSALHEQHLDDSGTFGHHLRSRYGQWRARSDKGEVARLHAFGGFTLSDRRESRRARRK